MNHKWKIELPPEMPMDDATLAIGTNIGWESEPSNVQTASMIIEAPAASYGHLFAASVRLGTTRKRNGLEAIHLQKPGAPDEQRKLEVIATAPPSISLDYFRATVVAAIGNCLFTITKVTPHKLELEIPYSVPVGLVRQQFTRLKIIAEEIPATTQQPPVPAPSNKVDPCIIVDPNQLRQKNLFDGIK